jgi:hypothetical protein
VASREDVAARFALAAQLAAKRSGIQWVTRLSASGELLGSTVLAITDTAHRRVEIGYTWLVPHAQRTWTSDAIGCTPAASNLARSATLYRAR